MKFRQVHLDFHTSEKINNIGGEFDKKQFQEALKAGYIDSITVFSKCHHGWAYHPSKANEMHPGLKFDLLGAQIEAAHEIGVKTPVYISAGLDEKMASRHPEWLIRNKDESTTWVPHFRWAGYHRFCFNSPYLDYLLEQIKEVCRNYDADGIFLDIVGVYPCYCQNCMKKLRDMGKNPYDDKVVSDFGFDTYLNYAKAVREAIDSVKPGLPVFHNAGHIMRGRRDLAHTNTHLELESLPTGGWGYDHFPLSATYSRTLGMDYLGMTGKFHKSWGEFGGFKHPNAIRYEVALSAAFGAKCSIGDQLHPLGKMDMTTYNLIGAGYKELKEREPWLDNVEPVTDVAILSYEAVNTMLSLGQMANTNEIDSGAVRMMLEGKYLFNVIDGEEDFNKYKVIILPDKIRMNDELTNKLKAYIQKGGKLLATGKSGLNEAGDAFAFDFGAKYLGENEYKPSYLRTQFPIDVYESTAFVMYSDSQKIERTTGEQLGILENSYFNRTVEHFCSHQHTPNDKENTCCGVVEGKDGIYIAWEIFSEYATMGSLILKKTLIAALDRLLGEDKTLKTSLGAQGIATLNKQAEENRYVAHFIYVSPVKRGENTEIVEDIIPVYDTKASIKVAEKIKKVYIAPENTEIDFTQDKDGVVEFKIDKIENSTLVVFNY